MNDWRAVAQKIASFPEPKTGEEPTAGDIAAAYLREALAALDAMEKRATDAEEGVERLAKTAKAFEQDGWAWRKLAEEYADKLSVAVIVLRRYRDGGGTPLDNYITTGQLIEMEAKLRAESRALRG